MKCQAKSFVLINILFPVPNVFSIMSSLLFAFKVLYASCTDVRNLSISEADAFLPPPIIERVVTINTIAVISSKK